MTDAGAVDPLLAPASLLQLLREELSPLPDKPEETPEATLKALWAAAQGRRLSVRQAAGAELDPPDAAAQKRLGALVRARLSGIPLAHLTGRQDFMGAVLLAGPEALVPRAETELLGHAAVEKAEEVTDHQPLVLDVCTGSGNLALGIALQVPRARVQGSDLSPRAVALARRNARFVGRHDVEFRVGDLLEPFVGPQFQGQADVVVCNPPYISTRKIDEMPPEISSHEPRLAFDGGPFGINLLRRLIDEAPEKLRVGGWLLVQVGPGQWQQTEWLFWRTGAYGAVKHVADDCGEVRVLAARRLKARGRPTDA